MYVINLLRKSAIWYRYCPIGDRDNNISLTVITEMWFWYALSDIDFLIVQSFIAVVYVCVRKFREIAINMEAIKVYLHINVMIWSD